MFDELIGRGRALSSQKRYAGAVGCFERAVRLRPGSAHARNDLGVALAAHRRHDEAIPHFREALRLDPDLAEAHSNLGNSLYGNRRHAEAIACYDRALQIRPDYFEARRNRASALTSLGRYEEAEAALQDLLRRQPTDATVLNELGVLYGQQGRLAEALDVFECALASDSANAPAHKNRAMIWLARGDYERGWPEYEWRWRCEEHAQQWFPRPQWAGEALAGRTILLSAEQGLGDTIQFVRFAPEVQRRGARVLLGCPGALAPLLASCPGVDRVLPDGSSLPPFDVYTTVMSLPALLGTTLATLPAEVPYLSAAPALVAHWAKMLEPIRGLRVGIVWQGNPQQPSDHHRSFRLERLEPLARQPGVRLISLQKGVGAAQLDELAGRFPVVDLGEPYARGGFLDTAAILKNLDLLVTSDTSVAHLAGALGVPTWVALHHAADWRWLRDRDDSPWYPTMRLFRQRRLGAWDEVFAHIAAELGTLAASARGRHAP